MEEQKEFKEFTNFDPTKDLSLAPHTIPTKNTQKNIRFSMTLKTHMG